MISPRTLQIIKNIEDLETTAESKDLIIVADLNCPTTINILKQVGTQSEVVKNTRKCKANNIMSFVQANATRKLRNPYRWLLIDRNGETNKITNDLDDLSILLDSEVIVSRKDGNQFTLDLSKLLFSDFSISGALCRYEVLVSFVGAMCSTLE